jgi:siroheme decarboxylase
MMMLNRVPSDFPVSERPYRDVAGRIGVTENDLIQTLRRLKGEGVIRRLAAVLYHRKVSYTHNAMVVWKVADQDMETVGRIMASFSEVTHCYERETGGYWDYTLYTMIHGRSEGDCLEVVRKISEEVGIVDYRIFYSKRELKKTALVAAYE